MNKYVQIIDLPKDDMKNSHLSICWKSLDKLLKEFEEDSKLKDEFKFLKING